MVFKNMTPYWPQWLTCLLLIQTGMRAFFFLLRLLKLIKLKIKIFMKFNSSSNNNNNYYYYYFIYSISSDMFGFSVNSHLISGKMRSSIFPIMIIMMIININIIIIYYLRISFYIFLRISFQSSLYFFNYFL